MFFSVLIQLKLPLDKCRLFSKANNISYNFIISNYYLRTVITQDSYFFIIFVSQNTSDQMQNCEAKS